jgi:ABC-2 type transport system permease protein
MSRGPIAETLALTASLIRFRFLASRRDWTSRKLYIAAGTAAGILALLIFGGTFFGVRTLAEANAAGLIFSIASWAFLVYLFTDLFIAFQQALNDLYLSSDMPILLAMPLRPASIVVAKFVLGVAQNEVYVAVFLLPFVLGYLAGLAAPWWAYPIALVALTLFPALLYAVLATITIVTLRFVAPRFAKEMLWIIAMVVPITFWLASFARLAHLEGDVSTLQLPATPVWLPSTWAGSVLAFAAAGDGQRALVWLWFMLLVTLVACPVGLSIASVGFAEGWSRGVSGKRASAVATGPPPKLSPVAAIVWKDVCILLRSPQLWFNHIASIGFIGYLLIGHQVQTPFMPLTVQLAMLQIGFVAVLDGTNPGMTALSLEHRAIWILRTGPLTPRQIFTAKLVSAYAQTSLISLMAAALLGIGYGFSLGDTLALIVFALLMASVSICYGAGFDTRFPSFDWENPNAINRGVRMIFPFLNALLVLILCGGVLAASRVALHGAWGGHAAVLVGLLWCGLVAAWVFVSTANQAVRNIAALEL